MCIIVAKYFPKIGWAGAKNRDRNYVPDLDFIESTEQGVSRMMMHDRVTGYKEGINDRGISILNTSLDVYDDESEIDSGKADTSPDGRLIARALLEHTVLAAVKVLIQGHLGGCTIVFDQETLYLIEASDQDGTKKFKYRARLIPHDQLVVRTNHGIWFPWAGFQRKPDDPKETRDRISSESRLLQAQRVAVAAQKPLDLVDGMCQVNIDNPQLNIMRFSTEPKKFRTTSQQLCVPKQHTLYCRPVSSNMQFDFWRLNRPDTNVWVEILSNRLLWQKNRGKKPFSHMHLKDRDQ
jgi:hypothetical protein